LFLLKKENQNAKLLSMQLILVAIKRRKEKEMKKLVVLLSLSMISPLALSTNNNPTIELTSAQMDNITAGVNLAGTADAVALAMGDFLSIFTQTWVDANGNAFGTGSVYSFAIAQAIGSDGTATNAAVATDASGNTRTFNISTDHQGTLFSQSAGIEVTFVLP
jgi:hypothetical protein